VIIHQVHSPFKQPAGARLARAALPVIFGVDVDTVGPVAGAISTTSEGYVVSIEQCGSGPGVELHNTVGFEVLVNDGRQGFTWVSSPVVAHSAQSVTIGRVPGNPTKIR
jgi:hypothetical protein